MIKRLIKLIGGVTLSSFSITCVIHANLGVFPVTAFNLSIANWLGISIGVAGLLAELVMMVIAFKMKEGLTLTGIINATVGSLLIDVWSLILPKHPLMVLGILLLPVAWMLSGSAGLGDTHQNLVMNGILKRTNKSMSLVRACQETFFMIIGLLGSGAVTPLTIILSLFFGKLMQFEYKLLKYRPDKVKHDMLIKTKQEM